MPEYRQRFVSFFLFSSSHPPGDGILLQLNASPFCGESFHRSGGCFFPLTGGLRIKKEHGGIELNQ